jgi:hypothetical protein
MGYAFKAHNDEIQYVIFNPEGTMIVSATSNKFGFWDANIGS